MVPWNGGVRAYYTESYPSDASAYWYESNDGMSWGSAQSGRRIQLDFTSRLKEIIDGRAWFEGRLDDFLAGGDPYPRGLKTMEIIYTSPLGKRKVVAREGEYLNLPNYNHEVVDGATSSTTLTIESAVYYYEDKLPLSKVSDATVFLGKDIAIGEGLGSYGNDPALAYSDEGAWRVEQQQWSYPYNYDMDLSAAGNGACVIVLNDEASYYPDESEMY